MVSAGGNLISIDSVNLSVDQSEQYYTQARQLAMTDGQQGQPDCEFSWRDFR